MTRGYAAIAVDSIRNVLNVGGVIRAAQVYGASLVVVGAQRYKHQPMDAMKGYRHIPVLNLENILDSIPYDCVPVAVELVDSAVSLIDYKHPERAFYIFGGEDCTLGQRILSKCRDVVQIPTNGPMNLAACVNVVLYDRLAKQVTR
ncbi:MAG: TrmH family RNA methyltransferase [Patescibacteria group bacterium]|nr:TrmH family RNA methyltransferase [Patescibacteria group bacterium]